MNRVLVDTSTILALINLYEQVASESSGTHRGSNGFLA
jgi:hypothetical protein